MRALLFLCCFCGVGHFAFAQSAKSVAAIQSTMAAQEAAWNKGDLELFMKGYWVSDQLLFIGKSGVTNGYQQTLNNYKKGYPDKTAMGELHFNLMRFVPLNKDHMLVIGQWQLTRSIGNIGGHFSLIWKKIKGQWVIIADHSS